MNNFEINVTDPTSNSDYRLADDKIHSMWLSSPAECKISDDFQVNLKLDIGFHVEL